MALEITKTAVFDAWLSGLRDRRSALRIAQRIERMQAGNFGDYKPVGGGVSELRIVGPGPGYRVYFTRRGAVIVVLLCGGDKSTQASDIRMAQKLAGDIR